MTNQTKNRPVETLRDGAIKAALWKNTSENGVFYNVTFARTYKDSKGELQDADSYSGSQLLRLSRLADLAYTRIGELGQGDRNAAQGPEDRPDTGSQGATATVTEEEVA
jgi:hypothetical protein